MSRFNEIRYGWADQVAEILDDTDDPFEIRAALINALERIAALEMTVTKLKGE